MNLGVRKESGLPFQTDLLSKHRVGCIATVVNGLAAWSEEILPIWTASPVDVNVEMLSQFKQNLLV